jgi:hypothetical protein
MSCWQAHWCFGGSSRSSAWPRWFHAPLTDFSFMLMLRPLQVVSSLCAVQCGFRIGSLEFCCFCPVASKCHQHDVKFCQHRACRWLRAPVNLQCNAASRFIAGLANKPSDVNMVITYVGAFPLEGLAHLAGSHLFVENPTMPPVNLPSSRCCCRAGGLFSIPKFNTKGSNLE